MVTVNAPVNMPPEIEQVYEEKRSDGEDDNVHVVPARFDAETVTAVPAGPEVGLKMSAGIPIVDVS